MQPQPNTTSHPWLHGIIRADTALLTRFNQVDHPLLDRIMGALTVLGNTLSWLLMGVGLLLMDGAAHMAGQRLAIAALSGAVIAQTFKRFFQRPRPVAVLPELRIRCAIPVCSSFPSGHTLTAFSVAMAFGGMQTPWGVALLLLAGGIAASRVHLGAHYPMDVLVGALMGGTFGHLLYQLGGAPF